MIKLSAKLVFFLGVAVSCVNGQQGDTAVASVDSSQLSVERIFGSGEFNDNRVGEVVWSRDRSGWFIIKQPDTGNDGNELIRVEASTGAESVVASAALLTPAGAIKPLPIDSFSLSADESKVLIFTNSRRVWRRNTRGDYWILNLARRELRQLGGDVEPSTMMFASFSPDHTRVAYVLRNNIYVQRLDDLQITPVTTDGSATLINGTSDWVNEEELDLRDCIRWSPDGTRIAFWQFDTSGVREFQLINNTENSYPRITSFAYPKTGEKNSATRLGVVSADGGAVQWLNIAGDSREHYLPQMEWTPDGSRLLIQQMNRLQNINRVMLVEPQNGDTQTILTETDEAWLENENPVRWVNGGKNFIWISERDGWRHAFLASVDGQPITRITHGEFDVISIEAVDEEHGWLYYAAAPANPVERHLFRCRFDGSDSQHLSDPDRHGWHTCEISPHGDWAILTYSCFMQPPVQELMRLNDKSVVRTLIDNQQLREKLQALRLPAAEFFRIDIGDETLLDCWALFPPDLDRDGKSPLLIHVYGEPHGQTVRNAWFGPRGLWHWMLAQQGYIVVSIENRGTMVPRGRAWRKMIYRQVGQLASADQANGVRALLQRWPFADSRKIAVWGWSGGGSMSLNAIFRYPDLYHTAMAVAPVPDQRLYDTIYQERYMGLPTDNANGYRNGSPLTFARQLKGNLLVVHGTGDDNCHYQGVELLMNELIAHDKEFTIMPYPNRTHSISEDANTTKHLYSLLTRFLQSRMPP